MINHSITYDITYYIISVCSLLYYLKIETPFFIIMSRWQFLECPRKTHISYVPNTVTPYITWP